MAGRTIHIAVSVDIDRHSDSYLRKEWLDTFRAAVGARTVRDIRQHCQLARMRGLEVFPPCDHVDERGHCLGHPKPDAS
jgi:hypothetical protein